jgi:adenylate cyclase
LLRPDPDRARRILEEGLQANPEAPTLHYNLACLDALQGDRDAAIGELRRAIAARSEAAGWARDDDDFASLRDDPEFRGLVGPS